jgi:hypothetical protein
MKDPCTKEEAKHALFGSKINPITKEDRQLIFEQYKILIDSTQKAIERFEASNNLFMLANNFIFTVLGFCITTLKAQLINIPFMTFLTFIGLITSIMWIRVTNGYKKISVINLLLIRTIEEHLPTALFSFKYDLEAEEVKERRVNIIVALESILPKLFTVIYGAGLTATIISYFGVPHLVANILSFFSFK